MKRHHDHGNSYKGKCLIGDDLQLIILVNLLMLWRQVWWHSGRHGWRKTGTSTSGMAGSRKSKPPGLAWASETSKPNPNDTHPKKSHYYSNKAKGPRFFQIQPLPMSLWWPFLFRQLQILSLSSTPNLSTYDEDGHSYIKHNTRTKIVEGKCIIFPCSCYIHLSVV